MSVSSKMFSVSIINEFKRLFDVEKNVERNWALTWIILTEVSPTDVGVFRYGIPGFYRSVFLDSRFSGFPRKPWKLGSL